MVIGEKIDAHAEGGHAAELGAVGQLAMLQSEAVVRRRDFGQTGGHCVENQFGRLVAIGVDVDLHPGGERAFKGFGQLLGRHIPQAIGRAIVIAGPAQPRRAKLPK